VANTPHELEEACRRRKRPVQGRRRDDGTARVDHGVVLEPNQVNPGFDGRRGDVRVPEGETPAAAAEAPTPSP